MLNVTTLHAQFEEDLPQITTQDTLKTSIRGFIRSDFRVFAGGKDTTYKVLERYGRLPVIRGGTWMAGRVKYEFKVRELAEDLTQVSLVCGISGYEEGVTNEVHFWNSNGILDNEIMAILKRLILDPETENFKENRMN
jgi:hypothetical protein